MSEQMQRISALQSRLEEQRHRAEELQRQGSSDLNIRIHDLQNEVLNLKETLGTRDKQVANLKNHLESVDDRHWNVGVDDGISIRIFGETSLPDVLVDLLD